MSDPWAERRFEEQIAQLIEQHRTSVPPDCGWADYEIRAVRGEGGFAEHAVSALGFRYQDFGMRESQAVSCQVCGGLFVDSLIYMRRHRLQCGWSR
jgi:hypothetical protein